MKKNQIFIIFILVTVLSIIYVGIYKINTLKNSNNEISKTLEEACPINLEPEVEVKPEPCE